MPTFDHAAYCDLAEAEIVRMADAVRGADPALPVPTCPGWSLADLVTHTGQIHRWAAHMVTHTSPRRVDRNAMDFGLPGDLAGLADWLAAGAAPTAAAFRDADPAAPMWAWGADKHARFWARRMVYETAVHRADAELALGRAFSTDADVAADGVDELLMNLPSAAYFAPNVEKLRGSGEVIALVMPGVATWRIELLADRYEWSRAESDAEVTVTGPPADLVLVLYGRHRVGDGGVTLTGEAALFEHWIANSAL